MSKLETAPQTTPVTNSVPMVNNELAVGDDLAFQRRWWQFERVIWIIFLAVVIADLLGCFGRGFLAQADVQVSNGLADIHYERVERFSTPSILTIQFGQSAVKAGKIKLWMSEDLVKPLGNQRIIPQPASSVLDHGGVLYSFDAATNPSSVEFALEPSGPGIYPLTVRVADAAPVTFKIYVMP